MPRPLMKFEPFEGSTSLIPGFEPQLRFEFVERFDIEYPCLVTTEPNVKIKGLSDSVRHVSEHEGHIHVVYLFIDV